MLLVASNYVIYYMSLCNNDSGQICTNMIMYTSRLCTDSIIVSMCLCILLANPGTMSCWMNACVVDYVFLHVHADTIYLQKCLSFSI